MTHLTPADAILIAISAIQTGQSLREAATEHQKPEGKRGIIVPCSGCKKTIAVIGSSATEVGETFRKQHVFTVNGQESFYCMECRPSHTCDHCYQGLWEDEGEICEETYQEFYEQFGNCFSETRVEETSYCCDADVSKVGE